MGILKHRGKTHFLSELVEAIQNELTPLENKMVFARTNDVPFSDLSEKRLKTEIDQIMVRGAAISGCPLPNTDFFADIIAEEIKIFIMDFGYQDLTVPEIFLAMRMNSRGGFKYPSGLDIEQVQFYGSCFNVDFLSKVLANYMTLRNILDRKFQNHIDGY
jgi:hypothetical protein